MPEPILYFLVTNSLHQDQRLHRICGSLSKNGYDITLVGVKKRNTVFTSKYFKTTSLKSIFKSGVFFYIEINFRFFFHVLFRKFDGVVANDLDTLLAGKLLTIIRRKKLFIDLHEYFTEVPELQGKGIKKKIWNLIGRFGISDKSINYTVNTSLAQILNDKYSTNFDTIYNYPFIKNSEISISDRKTYNLVYVGVVNKGRGLKQAILAIKNFEDITLTIIGIGDKFKAIETLITQHNLESRVFLKGFVNNQDIHNLLQGFDLGINLLESESQNYYYSSANKYFDYLMAGIPALSMRFPEYIKHNDQFETSVLIESLDLGLVKKGILKLKDNPSLSNKLKLNCEQAKKTFNWKSQERQLLKMYNKNFTL